MSTELKHGPPKAAAQAGPTTYSSMPKGNDIVGWRPVALFRNRNAASQFMSNTCRDYKLSVQCAEVFDYSNTEVTQVGWGVYVENYEHEDQTAGEQYRAAAGSEDKKSKVHPLPAMACAISGLTEEERQQLKRIFADSAKKAKAAPKPDIFVSEPFVAGGAK